VRRALAQEAARIMAEHGIDDYGFAKRKAAERLGVGEHAVLPKNSEVEAALVEYQRLFAADSHASSLENQRRAALAAMQLLEPFEPRLVGAVVNGSATAHQEILLHVFCDSAEAVSLLLLDAAIPYRVAERRVKMNAERFEHHPAVSFTVDDFEVEAIVFPKDGIRQSPLSPTDGRPMRRIDATDLELLLAAES
jgi:hypothetical protein